MSHLTDDQKEYLQWLEESKKPAKPKPTPVIKKPKVKKTPEPVLPKPAKLKVEKPKTKLYFPPDFAEYKDKMTYREMAEHFGVAMGTLYKYVYSYRRSQEKANND
jgi:hypothetical protein